MRRDLFSIISIMLLLGTSVPISVMGQDNVLANSVSAAIAEAEATIAEAEEAILAAADEGADTEDAQAYLNEAKASLELAMARGEDGVDDALFLANEAEEFATHARNIADEERNSIIAQREDGQVEIIDREEPENLEVRGRLFHLLEELEIQRQELALILEAFDGDADIEELMGLLRYFEQLLAIIREDIDVGRYDMAEVGIYNAEIILEQIQVGIREVESELVQRADMEIAEQFLLLVDELEREKQELLERIETLADERDDKELAHLLRDVSEILFAVRQDVELLRFDMVEEGIHHAREILGKVSRELADSAFELDARDDEFERLLHFVEDKLAFFDRLIEEGQDNREDLEEAEAIIRRLTELVRQALISMEENDMESLDEIIKEALGLVESLQAFLESPPHVRDIASGSVDRYFLEVKEALDESRRQLEVGIFVNADKAEEVILRAEDLYQKAQRALDEGRNELAFEYLEEAYHLVKGGLEDQRGDSSSLDIIIARINRVIENLGSIEKAINDSLDRENTGEIMELLGEIREIVSHARKAIANGDIEMASKDAEEGENMIERLFEKISHSKELAQDGDPFLEAEELRDRALRLIHEAAGIGVNIRGVEALVKVGDEALSLASGFEGEGNMDAARALSRVATKLYKEAGDLAEHVMEVAVRTEIAKVRSPEEREPASEIIVDNNAEEIEIHEVSGESTHIAKIGASIPRISYEVLDESGQKIEFSSVIRSLVEFEDSNNDGRIQNEEIIQILELDEIEWVVSQTEELVGDGKVIKVIYSAESLNYAVSLVLRVYETASIEFFRFGDKTIVYSVDGGAREVKFDLILTRWPWQSSESQLAMRIDLEGEIDGGEVSVDVVSDDENRLILRSQGVNLKVKWITKASLEQVDGSTTIIDVAMAHEISEGELRVDFIYPNFEESVLIHDPSVGLLDPVSESELVSEPIVAPLIPQTDPPNPEGVLAVPEMPGVEVENFYQLANPLYLIPVGIGVVVLVLATFLLRRRAN